MRKEVEIPEKFDIFGQTFKVVLDDELYETTGNMGECNNHTGIIKLQTDVSGYRLSGDEIKETYLHEVIHAIFSKIGFKSLCNDENLVELFANALYQVLKTSEYTNGS